MNEVEFTLEAVVDAFDDVFGPEGTNPSPEYQELRRRFLRELGEDFALEVTDGTVSEPDTDYPDVPYTTPISYAIVELPRGNAIAFFVDWSTAVAFLEVVRGHG